MFNLDLTKDEYQFIYNVFSKATLKDDRDLTCDFCPENKINCRCNFCEKIKYKLYRLIENL